MELILWRHADAEYGPADMERALTPKGERQAHKVGQWLSRNLPESCRILVSPAKRAIQTADAIGRKYKIVPEIAPGATPQALLLAANWPQRKEPVLLVGHQPTLGQVAGCILTGQALEMNIRKSHLWWIMQRDREGDSETFLKLVMSPEFVGK
jgi:phosphohistidine phosphatase